LARESPGGITQQLVRGFTKLLNNVSCFLKFLSELVIAQNY